MAKRVKSPKMCQICGVTGGRANLVPAGTVRESVAKQILSAFPEWSSDGYICRKDLNEFRAKYFHSLLANEKGQVSELEGEVLESLKDHDILSLKVEEPFEQPMTLGERLSDRLADFGGSWTFIILFAVILVGWMVVNSTALVVHPFDPYPYIFLNLILSCIAAIQAPIIMMSQNRQETRDRLRAQNDYQVNLKAELEIRQVHEKLDHLISVQWDRLIEIQDIQFEMMNDLVKKAHARASTSSTLTR